MIINWGNGSEKRCARIFDGNGREYFEITVLDTSTGFAFQNRLDEDGKHMLDMDGDILQTRIQIPLPIAILWDTGAWQYPNWNKKYDRRQQTFSFMKETLKCQK